MAKASKTGSARAGNGFDPKLSQLFIKEIEKHLEEKESEKGRFMQKCQAINEQINSVYERAIAAGIPKKVIKNTVKIRELEAKIVNLSEPEDDESGDTGMEIKLFREALGDFGDLPLGAAAVTSLEKAREAKAKAKAEKERGMPGGDAPPSTH